MRSPIASRRRNSALSTSFPVFSTPRCRAAWRRRSRRPRTRPVWQNDRSWRSMDQEANDMALKPKEQFQALKVPLIITAVVFALLVGGAFVWHLLRPTKEPPVVESKAPADQIRNIVFTKEDNEYVLYFSLCDKDGNYIARQGEVSLKISQLGTIGIENGPQFVNETT